MWSTEVWLIHGRNRYPYQGWATTADCINLLDVLFQKRIKAEICAKTWEIIGICQAHILPVFHDHVPAHESHLETQDHRVLPVIREDELECITVCHPDKSFAEGHVMAFIDGVITQECLSQMWMEVLFVPVHTEASKSNQVKQSGGILCHEIKASSLHTFVHSIKGGVIVRGLVCNIATSFGWEIGAEHKKFAMVVDITLLQRG